MSVTFVSCFYIIKSKFDSNTYIEWMNNFISIVNNFNLVIFTDECGAALFDTLNNPKITVIIKPIEQFYNYRYKEYWITNHAKNTLLNDKSSWQLTMLWCEKIWFVKECIERKYYETDYYGWCDIGYFRNRPQDFHTSFLSNWPSKDKILRINKNKIAYACINNNNNYINYLHKIINNKNVVGLPITPIPAEQTSVAGGFFILYKDKIDWWAATFGAKLKLYFENNYLVKDDQIILIDCILSQHSHFCLFRENNPKYDNWFMFQRIYF